MTDAENKNLTRAEYRVTGDDTLASLLERVRQTSSKELLLDITENDLLLKDGSLRRALVSAASEFEKSVAFSFSEKQNMRKSTRAETLEVTREKPQKTREREGAGKPVPVAVFSRGKEKHSGLKEIPKIKLGESGKRIAVFFSFFAGILLAGGIFFVLPRADIKITPEIEPISMNLALTATASALNVDAEKGIVPAQILNYEEETNNAFPVKGVLQQGEKARGQVTIVNRTVSEQKIKGKSRLGSEDNLIFTMDEAAVVAPHSSITVKVTAEQGGTAGNINAGKLYFVALPKTDQEILYAEVSTPLMGGTEKTTPALSRTDMETAKKQLLTEKQEAIKKKIETSLTEGVVRDDRFLQFDLAELTPAEKEGAQISEFHLVGKIRAKYFVFKQEDIFNLVRSSVNTRVTEGKVLGKPLDVSGLVVDKIDWQNNAVSFNFSLQNYVRNNFDFAEMQKQLVARTVDGAGTFLRAVPGVKDVTVKLSPFWVKRVPGFKHNIKLELVLP